MATILALGLYKSSGGPSKSIRAMQEALNAEVISWVDPIQISKDELIWKDAHVVAGSSWPILRQLLLAPKKSMRVAEEIISTSRIVSCHSPWRGHMLWLYHMHRKAGVPYWFVPHGGLDPYVFEEQGFLKRLFLRLGGRAAIENAACVIFTTKAERDKAIKVCRPQRSEIVYWPLNDEDFSVRRGADERRYIRGKLGIPSEARCLLYFGRLHAMKRPLETIEAIAASQSNAHLIIVGNEFGVSLEDCRSQAADLGLEDRVHVIGPVYGETKAHYFAAADAYISLSRRENFNFAAAESMAAGLPLILSPGNDLV
ncbi:MAG: glycosyltransferase, partial [Verrucomicrobiota bacterium]